MLKSIPDISLLLCLLKTVNIGLHLTILSTRKNYSLFEYMKQNSRFVITGENFAS
jgi:hypothetical protein